MSETKPPSRDPALIRETYDTDKDPPERYDPRIILPEFPDD